MNFDLFKFHLERFLGLFDIRGGVILGLFSLEMLALIAYCIVTNHPFPETVRDVYLGVVAGFSATNVAKQYAISKNGGSNEPKV